MEKKTGDASLSTDLNEDDDNQYDKNERYEVIILLDVDIK